MKLKLTRDKATATQFLTREEGPTIALNVINYTATLNALYCANGTSGASSPRTKSKVYQI